jgi:hypothetical protein
MNARTASGNLLPWQNGAEEKIRGWDGLSHVVHCKYNLLR